jgi:hypothetical protein
MLSHLPFPQAGVIVLAARNGPMTYFLTTKAVCCFKNILIMIVSARSHFKASLREEKGFL